MFTSVPCRLLIITHLKPRRPTLLLMCENCKNQIKHWGYHVVSVTLRQTLNFTGTVIFTEILTHIAIKVWTKLTLFICWAELRLLRNRWTRAEKFSSYINCGLDLNIPILSFNYNLIMNGWCEQFLRSLCLFLSCLWLMCHSSVILFQLFYGLGGLWWTGVHGGVSFRVSPLLM